ncbi:hypothetical protein ACWDRB_39325 [Nonomuraea sp. NPDC003707]
MSVYDLQSLGNALSGPANQVSISISSNFSAGCCNPSNISSCVSIGCYHSAA